MKSVTTNKSLSENLNEYIGHIKKLELASPDKDAAVGLAGAISLYLEEKDPSNKKIFESALSTHIPELLNKIKKIDSVNKNKELSSNLAKQLESLQNEIKSSAPNFKR